MKQNAFFSFGAPSAAIDSFGAPSAAVDSFGAPSAAGQAKKPVFEGWLAPSCAGGRRNRRSYFLAWLALLLAFVALLLVFGGGFFLLQQNSEAFARTPDAWFVVLALAFLTVFSRVALVSALVGLLLGEPDVWFVVVAGGFLAAFFLFAACGMFLMAQRLRDLGWSGWWAVPLGLVGAAVDASYDGVALVSAFMFLTAAVLLLFVPGTKGANKYGADPLAPRGGCASADAPAVSAGVTAS